MPAPGDDRFFTEVTAGKAAPFALPETDRDNFLSQAGRSRLASLQSELKQLKDSGPPEPPLACALSEGKITEQHVFVRGNPENRGELVPKRFPLVLVSGRLAADHGGPIHLLVTDVVMPQMSGRELAERLAAIRPSMKRLFMSGYSDHALVHDQVTPGFAFLQKPFTPDVFARKVRSILDSEPAQPLR
jgi:CheY-like chemotaxis protein